MIVWCLSHANKKKYEESENVMLVMLLQITAVSTFKVYPWRMYPL